MQIDDTIPRILPSDLPIEALENLARALDYRFRPHEQSREKRIQDFMNAVVNKKYVWNNKLAKGQVGGLEDPSSVQGLDVVGNPFEQKDNGTATFEAFVLVSPGIAFSLTGQRQRSSGFDITNLEAHPGEYYPQLVRHARQAYLTKRLTGLYEEAMKGSTPIHYEDFLNALDGLAKTHPRLASGRDARILSEGQRDELERPARSVIPRGRA